MIFPDIFLYRLYTTSKKVKATENKTIRLQPIALSNETNYVMR